MCFCEKPTVNTEAWRAPKLAEGDVLLYDEPGRCGGLDHHSHHFRVVVRSGSLFLLVRHGGGDAWVRLFPLSKGKRCEKGIAEILGDMDSTSRYWMLATIYSAYWDGATEARDDESGKWRKAAVEKRIKTRKFPSRGVIKVWIEPAIVPKGEPLC